MQSKSKTSAMASRLIIAFAVVVVGLAALVAVRPPGGRSLGLRGALSWQAYLASSAFKAVADSGRIKGQSQGSFTNIIFLHHSVGYNLIDQGGVRERFRQAGYSFWDHDYNSVGLRDASGKPAGYTYNVPDDNTDPDGLARLFAQPVSPYPLNALSGLLQHQVIIFKSCFAPANHISSDEQLAQYTSYYLGIRAVLDKHPDKIFILVSSPPLNPADTNAAQAARARDLANWLKSDEFLRGHPNVFAFDLFEQLAGSDPAAPDYSMLRTAYQDGYDSHPNRRANETIGPLFVDFVIRSIQSYRAR